MGMIDLFAWIVLIVLALSTVAVIVFLAMLPGMIATQRHHPWTQAGTVAGWVTLVSGLCPVGSRESSSKRNWRSGRNWGLTFSAVADSSTSQASVFRRGPRRE